MGATDEALGATSFRTTGATSVPSSSIARIAEIDPAEDFP
jgi:hypothetical protein